MHKYAKSIEETVSFLKDRLGAFKPQVAMVLGTGLGALAERMDAAQVFPYADLPHFPRSTVESHASRLLAGQLNGRNVLALQGRFHLYEGYGAAEVGFPIRVAAGLGAQVLIVSNAAGGLNPRFRRGELMLIYDHINLTGHNPLRGPHEKKSLGERFPDMSCPYDPQLAILAEAVALEERIPLHRGVYVGVLGPSMETPAETRMLRLMGADAVGMSTVCEVICARQAGMRVLGISCITNVNLPDAMEPAPIEAVIAAARAASGHLSSLVEKVIERAF
ncbi:MAG: purine-nucleoside phosphorylase [Pseudomonadota bacterium]